MNFTIRKAEIKDAPGIAKVHVETWQSHYRGQVPDEYLSSLSVEKRTERWKENLSNQKPGISVFVADNEGIISGFCSVGPAKDIEGSRAMGELYAIYVDPAKHGLGIGSALMNAGLDFLRQQNFKEAILWVLKTNKNTIDFYKSKGWRFDGGEKKEEKDGFTFEEVRYRMDL